MSTSCPAPELVSLGFAEHQRQAGTRVIHRVDKERFANSWPFAFLKIFFLRTRIDSEAQDSRLFFFNFHHQPRT